MKLLGWGIIIVSVVFLSISIGGLNGELPQEMFVLLAFIGIIIGAYVIYRSGEKQ